MADIAVQQDKEDKKEDNTYYTFIGKVSREWKLTTMMIKAQDHTRIKKKTGFVYSFIGTSDTSVQLQEWIQQETFDYMCKNFYSKADRVYTIGQLNTAMNIYIEKRMLKYTEEFSLKKLSWRYFE